MMQSLIDPPTPFSPAAEWEAFLEGIADLPEPEQAEMKRLAKEAEETRAELGIS